MLNFQIFILYPEKRKLLFFIQLEEKVFKYEIRFFLEEYPSGENSLEFPEKLKGEEVGNLEVELALDLDMIHCFKDAVKNKRLELCEEGIGGTYFVIEKNGQKFAVYKPSNEEAGCINNPKKNGNSSFPGIKPGEGYLREVAVYMLDHEHRAKVPFTQIVKEGENFGSLQKFLENDGSMADYGNSGIMVENVHNIAQLDIRIMNNDRNEENLLIVKSDDGTEIFPIDHAYSLPSTLGEANFYWLNWKQAKQPNSELMSEYIKNINIENDSKVLRKIGISEESVKVMKLATMVLKRGAQVGWNFFQIGSYLVRPSRNEFSKLEFIVMEAESNVGDFWENITNLMQEKIVRIIL